MFLNIFNQLAMMVIVLFLFSAQAAPPTSIVCTHPTICALAKVVINQRVTKKIGQQINFHSPITNVVDPHHFEPGISEMKKILGASHLITAPQELQHWEGEMRRWRKKRSSLNTLHLDLPRKLDDLYQSGNRHAMAHFWLYPKLLCLFEKKIIDTLPKWGVPINKSPKSKLHKCSYLRLDHQATTAFNRLKGKLIIVTHDAIMPWLKRAKADAHPISSADHHHEITPTQIKALLGKLNQQSDSTIWIMEKNIPIPKLISSRIAKGKDHVITFAPWQSDITLAPDSALRALLKEIMQVTKKNGHNRSRNKGK